MSRPNLFDFARSELSQDAFLCWILSWADIGAKKYDESLHSISRSLISKMFQLTNRNLIEYAKVEVQKQYKNIDILVVLDGNVAIIIEDKIHSQEHSNQLSRYLSEISADGYKDVLPIYLQTGEQSNYENVIKEGFIPFKRQELLNILTSIKTDNCICNDFIDYLSDLESKFQSYNILPLDQWDWYSWQGFYCDLKDHLNDGDWGYVANPNGGFLGFWWHGYNDKDSEQYLQLEEQKLCFKIAVEDKAKSTDLKWFWHEKILESAELKDINIIKPSRLASGYTMTVAILDDDFRKSYTNGSIDMDATVSVLKNAQNVLDRAVNNR